MSEKLHVLITFALEPGDFVVAVTREVQPAPGGGALRIGAWFFANTVGHVQDRFDIVGFDPRGVGQSSAVDCVDDLDPYYDVGLKRARLALLTRDEAGYREDLRTAQSWIQRYFDARARGSQAALAQLKQLSSA